MDRSAAYAGALRRQEHRRRRPGRTLRGPGLLRHRRGRADLRLHRHLRHRARSRGPHRRTDPRALRPAPLRHHQDARPGPPDLPQDRRLRPLRPRASRSSPGSAPTRRRPCAPRRGRHYGRAAKLNAKTLGSGVNARPYTIHPAPRSVANPRQGPGSGAVHSFNGAHSR